MTEPTKKEVKNKKKMPLFYKWNPTWYEKGTVFKVEAEQDLPQIGLCYKLSYSGFVYDGWQVAKGFEVLKDD